MLKENQIPVRVTEHSSRDKYTYIHQKTALNVLCFSDNYLKIVKNVRTIVNVINSVPLEHNPQELFNKICNRISGTFVFDLKENKQKIEDVLYIFDSIDAGYHLDHTSHSFNNLIGVHYPSNFVKTLNTLSCQMQPGKTLVLVSVREIDNFPDIVKILKCNKFTNIQKLNTHTIIAKRRSLLKYTFDNDRLVLEETFSKDKIINTIAFSKAYYQKLNFNFIEAVDILFAEYTDYFVCSRVIDNEIICVTRFVWHLPNHYLPMMLATQKEDSSHIELIEPDNYNYGEAMGIYLKSYSGAKAYKECMKTMLYHLVDAGIDIAFTTHEAKDLPTGNLYKEKFGFKETGINLEYGNFGGRWRLLYGTRKDVISTMETHFIKK